MNGIEAVLAAHEWTWRMATPTRPVIVCSCGDELVSEFSSIAATLDDHRSHVAAEIAAWLLADEQVERAIEAIDRDPDADYSYGAYGTPAAARAALTAVLGGGDDE